MSESPVFFQGIAASYDLVLNVPVVVWSQPQVRRLPLSRGHQPGVEFA